MITQLCKKQLLTVNLLRSHTIEFFTLLLAFLSVTDFQFFTLHLISPVSGRREPCILLEHSVEVLGILETEIVGNLSDGLLRTQQH